MTNTTIIPHDHQLRLQQEREQAPVILKPPPQMTTTKKQARRRTHTSRPYQERLLNMAEARREIVTALKIHRANMLRQQQRPTLSHHHREPPQPPLPPLRQCQSLMIQQLRRHEQQHEQQQVQVVSQYHDQNQVVGEEEAPPASTSSFAADLQLGDDPLPHWIAAGDASAGSHYYCSSSPFVHYGDLTQLEVELPTAMGGMEQLARSLPAQPLGLNLSFQGFGGSVSVDAAEGCDQDLFGGVPLIQPSSLLSPASSSYYSPEATEMASGTQHASPALISTVEEYSPPPAAFMPMLDDGEMQSGSSEAQGEETAADVAAASAWWSKILLESMESGGEVAEGGAADGCTAEDVAAAISLPVEWRWLCDNDGVVDEQGAVVKGTAEPPDVMETMLTDGNYYTFCYSDEAGRRRGRDDINLPW
ncbi:hypothetical protein HU200_046077 [Digitaria exilis]|uniref:Uncharacterized protein n=1 Tax=Digitaria exilis TaxID=1010633 RepID=A0A835AZ33_9POAL|nr:hypothetical protein HU200_046077 [Digitaria exilis]CAB3458612.1 unnamed protein product [Digitaria exilis]